MEVACPLTLFNQNLGIACAANNLHSIPIGLNSIHHGSLEVWLWDFVSRNDMVEVLLKNYLSFLIMLEVAASNGHNALVRPIVDVTCHCGPTCDLLEIIGHDPSIRDHCQVASTLPSRHKCQR